MNYSRHKPWVNLIKSKSFGFFVFHSMPYFCLLQFETSTRKKRENSYLEITHTINHSLKPQVGYAAYLCVCMYPLLLGGKTQPPYEWRINTTLPAICQVHYVCLCPTHVRSCLGCGLWLKIGFKMLD